MMIARNEYERVCRRLEEKGLPGIYPRNPSLADRLNGFTSPNSTGCLIWRAGHDSDGYGRIQHDGQKVRVHRLAWELHNGPIPEDLLILHSCDNPPCCEIGHLRMGTQAENIADREARGRGPHQQDTNEAPTLRVAGEWTR